jgi:response regulator of citrate/malate metabolism
MQFLINQLVAVRSNKSNHFSKLMYKGSDTFKYIIIDKSAAARKGLHAFCNHYPSLELYGLYDSTEHAVARIKPSNTKIDLIFLGQDTYAPQDLAELAQLPGKSELILLSSEKKMAFTAFEIGALDFLHKPIDKLRFKQTVEKFHQTKSKEDSELQHLKAAYSSRVEKALFKQNLIHLLLNRANRTVFELLNYIEYTPVTALGDRQKPIELGHLQICTNQHIAAIVRNDFSHFATMNSVPLAPLMQAALKHLHIYAQRKNLHWVYDNNYEHIQTRANPEILTLVIEQILSLLIQFAPNDGTIHISAQYEFQELQIIIDLPDLELDETIQKRINAKLDDLNTIKHLDYKDGAAIHYFLERMDGYVFIKTKTEQGTRICIVLEGHLA